MKKDMSFEEKLKKLEEIVSELEKDDMNLDNSIENYSLAMKLIKECDLELKTIEAKVSKIVNNDGSVTDFEVEN